MWHQALPLKQLQLLLGWLWVLRVELAILLLAPLPCDVAADDILAAVTTDRVDVVAARPERAAPELLLDGRHAQEYLTDGTRRNTSQTVMLLIVWTIFFGV